MNKKHPKGYWTKERVLEAARQCESIKKFEALYRGAYNAVLLNGWTSDLEEVLPRLIKPSGYWTRTQVIETASNCNTRVEFIEKYVGAYNAARNNGWMDELDEIFTPVKIYWTKELVFEVANKCTTWKEFHKTYDAAYKAALKNGWLDEVKTILPCGRGKYYWTKEHIFEAARQSKSRNEFQKTYEGAYTAAWRNGWLDELHLAMKGIWEIKGDRFNRALYAIISYSRHMIYIGISYNIEKRYQDGHSKKPTLNVRELIAGEHKLIQITDYIYYLAASKLEGMFVDHFRELGWTVVNKAKPGTFGGANRKWTEYAIRVEAKKFKTKADFLRDSCSAYGAALHYGIIDELFYNGTYGETQWTKENIIKEAAPFNKKSDFEKHNSSAYQAACRMNLIDDIFYVGYYNIWTTETVTEVAK